MGIQSLEALLEANAVAAPLQRRTMLSDSDVESLLADLSIRPFATRDEQEVAGYAETMEQIFQSWEHIPLTENHIRQLHRDLLRHSDKQDFRRKHITFVHNHVKINRLLDDFL